MKKLLALAGLILTITACTGDSSFPTPTGKGTVRAVHAMKGSPEAAFAIEERVLDTITYKSGSTSQRWDDFSYNFNFDVAFLGESSPRRIASHALKVDANRDYSIVLTGSVTAPTVTVWEGDESSFETADTIFQTRFAHAAESLGDIDIYFAAPGTAPVLGEERGTLSFGGILDPISEDTGDFELTITAAGDPANIIYQSSSNTYAAQNAFIIPIFDGDEADVAPYSVRLLNGLTGLTALPDVRFPPTIRLIQASIDLPPSDVYDDDMLSNLVLNNHAFGDISGDISVPGATAPYTYTAVGNVSAVQFEGNHTTVPGNHSNFVVIGTEGMRAALSYVPDRRSIATFAKLRFLSTASNHPLLDLYIVAADQPIDDANRTAVLGFSVLSGTVALDTGDYDVYLTTTETKTVLTGPVRHTVSIGDVSEFVIFDTVDPATAELRLLPSL